MDLSKVRLIAVDMDGTLLNSEHAVSPEFWPLHRRLVEFGVTFAAASGRQYASILDKLGAIEADLTVVAENGALARHDGDEVVKTVLPKGALPEIIDRLRKLPEVKAVLCAADQAYIHSEDPDFIAFVSEFYSSYVCLDDLAAFEGDLLKVALYHPESSETFIYPHFEDLAPELVVKISSPFWVDISHPDANKGHALRMVQDRLGITRAETLAVGDFLNDIEMLGRADFSYAMENAHPDVTAAARFRTGSNDALGVEEVLRAVIEAYEHALVAGQ